jgi:hypothetical protein
MAFANRAKIYDYDEVAPLAAGASVGVDFG